MYFIILSKFRHGIDRAAISATDKVVAGKTKDVKVLQAYWTLGRYDSVFIIEAPSEKVAMAALLGFGKSLATETLVALPRDEALKLLK